MQLDNAFIPHRHSRLTSALVLLLLLVLALTQFSSSGVVRGGEDEGSGIGGTGRTLTPSGESGIGGTGRKPFLTLSNTQEVEIQWNPSRRDEAVIRPAPIPGAIAPVALSRTPSVARVARRGDQTTDSSAIDISEAIQISLDADALILANLRTAATAAEWSQSSQSGNTQRPAAVSIEVETRDGTEPATPATEAITSWAQLAKALNNPAGSVTNSPVTGASHSASTTATANSNLANADYNPDDPARLSRPDRIQRPQLPPRQRLSPLSRTAILPPRVKPLRL